MRRASRAPRRKWPPVTSTATPSIRNGTTPSNHGHKPDPLIPARALTPIPLSEMAPLTEELEGARFTAFWPTDWSGLTLGAEDNVTLGTHFFTQTTKQQEEV